MLQNAKKIIGREQELKILNDLLAKSSNGESGLISIEGRSGYGKSYLIDNFRQHNISSDGYLLYGQASTTSAQLPFNVLSSLINQIIGFINSDRVFASQLINDLSITQREILSQIFPNLSEALEINHTTIARTNVLNNKANIEALTALFQSFGSPKKPALIILDDFQWADELTVLFVEYWAKAIHKNTSHNNYTDIIIAYRSDEVSDEITALKQYAKTSIQLKALDYNSIKDIVENVLSPVSGTTIAAINRISKGSPFIAESLIRSFIESGTVKLVDGLWTLDSKESSQFRDDDDVNFLKRRFEVLSDNCSLFLKAAAVMGKNFNCQVIADVCNLNTQDLKNVITDSEQRHLIQITGFNNYSFTHDKLRELLLSLLSEEEMKQFHLQIAKCLQSVNQDTVFELAFHFNKAGIGENALPYILKAASEAHDRYALDMAEEQYRIALKYFDILDKDTKKLVNEKLADILMLSGKYAQAEKYYKDARSLLQNALDKARIEKKLGELSFKQGDIKGCIEALRNGLEMLGEKVPRSRIAISFSLACSSLVQLLHIILPGFFIHRKKTPPDEKESLILHFYLRMAYAEYFASDLLKIFQPHIKALNRAEVCQPSKELSQIWACHAMGLGLIPLFKFAFRYSHKALAIQEEIKDDWCKAQALNMYGNTLYCYGDNNRCITACTEAKKIFDVAGDRWEANIGSSNVAYAIYRLGNLTEAAKFAKETFLDSYEVKDLTSAASCISAWSKATSGAIPHELAKKLLDEDCQFESQPTAELCTALAIYYLSHNRTEEALKYADRAKNIALSSIVVSEYTVASLPWYLTIYRFSLGDFPNTIKIPKDAWKIAKKTLKKAKLYKNNLPHALREYGIFYAMEGNVSEAQKYLELSAETADHQKAMYELAQSLLALASIKQTEGLAGWEPLLAESKKLLDACKADIYFQKIHGANPLRMELVQPLKNFL